MRRASWLMFLLVLTSCATGEAASSDQVGDADDASTSTPPPDGSSDAGTNDACTLGTPDHCGKCTTSCPGANDARTQPTGANATPSGTCDITCKGEFYDLDGNAANGCEAEDPKVQDTEATALPVALPDANPTTIQGLMYGDTREHDVPPVSRPL